MTTKRRRTLGKASRYHGARKPVQLSQHGEAISAGRKRDGELRLEVATAVFGRRVTVFGAKGGKGRRKQGFKFL